MHSALAANFVDEFFKAFESSIDRTLLRETLRLTPQQRFDKFAAFMLSVMELRKSGDKHRLKQMAETGAEPDHLPELSSEAVTEQP